LACPADLEEKSLGSQVSGQYICFFVPSRQQNQFSLFSFDLVWGVSFDRGKTKVEPIRVCLSLTYLKRF
jgi:hypothetical protein